MAKKAKQNKHSITEYEIARMAGVSQSTVSRVLNGNTFVAPDKEQAVLEVVGRFNYQRNLKAQGLVSGNTFEIGVLTRHLGQLFFSEILRGIGKGIESTNYHLTVGVGSEDTGEERQELEFLISHRVEGLIVQVSEHLPDEYLCALAEELPLIVIGRTVQGLENQCVVVKNFSGAYQATSYLIERGHRYIAHIAGPLNLADSIARRDGYVQALVDHGLDVIPELVVVGNYREASGQQAVEELLVWRDRLPFTAIFAANDQMAIGARLRLFDRRIAVPEDISLVGFDDLQMSQYMIPPLTTIRQPIYYMGVMAAYAMVTALSGGTIHLPEFPVELVVRQSVAFR